MGYEPEDGALGIFDAANIEPVYQPIFDLRDGSVVGLRRSPAAAAGTGSPRRRRCSRRRASRAASPSSTARAARARAGRGRRGRLGAPFCLFVNADAGALEDDLPETPRAGFTLVM